MVAGLSENSGNKRKLPSWQSSNYQQNSGNEDDKMESGEDRERASARKELESSKEEASEIRSVSSASKGTGEDSVAKAERMSGDARSGKRACNAVSGKALQCKDGSHNQHQSPKGRQLDPKTEFSKAESSNKPKRKTPLKATRKNLEDDTGEEVAAAASSQRKPPLEKFLDGVVFALSGLVNPERANIREIAIQMGAHYRPDWTSDCTLLVCAFPNTPKFNQVKNDNGTIVSKAWILDCYKQKELLEIDRYLMHAGKPWRNVSISVFNDANGSTSGQKRSKCGHRSEEPRLTIASLPEIEQWVHTDVASCIAWLQKQESPPKEGEMKSIAIQGIELCLEDAIECLKNKQSVESIVETWDFVPRAVRELADRERQAKDVEDVGNVEDLLSEAERLKWIYASELKKRKGEEESINPKEEEEEDDESTDKMTETSDTESDDGTQTLGESDIIEAKAKIAKMLSEKKV